MLGDKAAGSDSTSTCHNWSQEITDADLEECYGKAASAFRVTRTLPTRVSILRLAAATDSICLQPKSQKVGPLDSRHWSYKGAKT